MVQQLQKYFASYIGNSSIENAYNNAEKYSLRRRQRGQKSAIHQIPNQMTQNQQIGNFTKTIAKGLPKLRKHRVETASQIINKFKTKAAPLSKYRRKTANARERSRMREINLAFENLRQCVPLTKAEEDIGYTNEKLTKITTLRLAMNYIRKLTEALNDPKLETDFLHRNMENNYEERKTLNNCISRKQNNDPHCNPVKPQLNKSKHHSKRNTNDTKKSFNILGAHNKPFMATINASNYLFTMNSDPDGKKINLSEAYTIENSVDFNHKYKPSQVDVKFISEPLDVLSIDKKCTIKSPIRNPLQINLCILNECSENEDVALDQQPLSCSSPFLAMDPFNPFSDLLQHDLLDHNSLDFFLT